LSIPDDFAALRDRDRAAAPAFDQMIARPPPARRTSPVVYVLPAAAAALAMAAAFVLWIATSPMHAAPPRHVAVASDPEPLGFLLDEPVTLARVPDFDSSPIKERR
jgi:hypothetical protein